MVTSIFAISRAAADRTAGANQGTVLHMLPDFAQGGGQILLLRALSNMPLERWRHVVCGLGDGLVREKFQSAGFETVLVPFDRIWRWPRSLAAVLRVIRREGVTLVHTNNTPKDRLLGQAAALLSGLPVVNTFHALPSPPQPVRSAGEIPGVLKRHAEYAVNRILIRLNVAGMSAVSRFIRDLHAQVLRLPPSRIAVIHPGLEPISFADHEETCLAALRRSLGLEGRAPVLIYVGRLEPSKGQRLWLPVVAELQEDWPEICLLLAGEGPDGDRLEAEAKRLGISAQVKFLGVREDVPALLKLADVFVSASLTEGFGIAVLEAMAARLPVVAYDLPAYREFVSHGVTGLVTPTPEPEDLTAAIRSLLSRPERMAEMGAAGYAAAKQFAIARTVEQLSELYERAQLTGRRQSAG